MQGSICFFLLTSSPSPSPNSTPQLGTCHYLPNYSWSMCDFYFEGKTYSSNNTSFTCCWLYSANDLEHDDFSILKLAFPNKNGCLSMHICVDVCHLHEK